MADQADAVIRLEDYRPTPYSVSSIDLAIDLNGADTKVTSRCAYERREGTEPGTPLELVGDELQLTGVMLDSQPLPAEAYEASASVFVLKDPPAGPFTLEITTAIDPTTNTKLEGLYKSNSAYCTQCEAEGFRRITYFYDRPDVLTVYTTRIEGDQGTEPVLLANGNLVESGPMDGGRHFAVWNDPFPKPSYLFAMVAGDLAQVSDTFTTRSGREVALHIYVEHGNEDRCGYAMDALKRSMRWDEETFGREYDLDIFMIVAVSDFNMGAMENKGLNVFNDRYILADPQSATDQDYHNIEAIIAHEYFHNWTGNRITCRDWFQLCLKEGLTVYRDQEFTADTRSRPVERISDVRVLKAFQFPEDAGPLAHPVRPRQYREINNFYTTTIYEKGAEIVGMLKTVLGADGFKKGMDLYFDRHDGDAATIEDFLSCFADATGADLRQFALWYEQSGTPHLSVSTRHDAASRRFHMTIEQSCPPTPGQEDKSPFHIPVRFGLVGPNGQDMEHGPVSGADVSGDVLHLKNARHDIIIEDVATPPVPSLLRGFTAPVNMTEELTLEDRLFLIRHDQDGFNRWQALQTAATEFLIEATRKAETSDTYRAPDAFLSAIGELCTDDDLEHAFRAQALQLPSQSDLARDIGSNVDPDAIYSARQAVLTDILAANRDQFIATYESLASSAAYSPDADSAGQRSLRNILLSYLALDDQSLANGLVTQHYHAADNMTDRSAALSVAAHMDRPETADVLGHFHETYCSDPLNLDKWFVAQATAPLPGALDTVKSLLKHSGFSLTNPNRVRSVIGAFASGNRTQFNRPDGEGYRFVAGKILELDKANPQVAARLATAFRSWRALEPGRRSVAKAVLEGLASKDGLSRDTTDIVTRTLG